MFVVNYAGWQILFDCSFDDDIDEYPSKFQVFCLPNLQPVDFAGSWDDLRQLATDRLGEIPVNAVIFDDSRRQEIDSGVLEQILAAFSTTRPVI